DFTVHGYVAGMPQASERGDRFLFRIESCVGPSAARTEPPCPAGRDIRLAWYRSFAHAASHKAQAPAGAGPAQTGLPVPAPLERRAAKPGPQPGERWQLTVRLKRSHALLNPNAFDAELRSLEEGIAANGYVSAKPPP